MTIITAVYGSPRKQGNTAALLNAVLSGVTESFPKAEISPIYLCDYNLYACRECYACEQTNGVCIVKDDFLPLQQQLLNSRGVILAAPIFFYSLNAQAKVFIDRFQGLWVKKYKLDGYKFDEKPLTRKGLFISAGATKGKELFTGSKYTMRYFFDTIDAELIDSLLCPGLDFPHEAAENAAFLAEAREKGKNFGALLAKAT